jgi:subtilase family protein
VTAVPFDEENRGDPFQGDFPGWADDEHRRRLGTAVQRQTAELTQLRREPGLRQSLLGTLDQRRHPQQPGDGIVRFDYLPAAEGFDSLLVRGELLLTAESYGAGTGQGAQAGQGTHSGEGGHGGHGGQGAQGRHAGQAGTVRDLLAARGLTETDVGSADLRGRIVRLTHPTMTGEELSSLARELRSLGHAAAVCNITPTGPVSKAIGGPEPTAPPPGSSPDGPCPGTPCQVAIVDTGITPEMRADGWLAAVPRGADTDPLDAFPTPGGDGMLDLDAGHGTFVAGIIQQVAPDADIRVYRAIDSDGIGSEIEVADAMIRAVRDGAKIVNLSVGCQSQDDVPPIALQAALDVIAEIQQEEGREVIIVAAAGNFGDERPCWPAAFDQVVAVAAVDANLAPVAWSSRGSWVTCSTVGEGQRSTFVPGQEATPDGQHLNQFGQDSWAVWSGTSFSAPQIAGALARLHNGQPLSQALDQLLATGQPVPDFGQALRVLQSI